MALLLLIYQERIICMFDALLPDLWVDTIAHIPLSYLSDREIFGLIIDIDNTIAKDNSLVVEPFAEEFIQKARANGIQVCLVSNNNQARVAPMGQKLGCPTLHKAGKPAPQAYDRALSLLNVPKKHAAMIGDQLFTDIYGGNRSGLHTILVSPVDKHEIIGIRLKRPLEKFVLSLKGMKRNEA